MRSSPHPVERQTHIATEPAWFQGLRRNDAVTLRALYKESYPAVKRYVLQNSGTASDAEDVFQEAVAVLWLSAKEGRINPAADPGGFLYQVAKNKWLDVLRSAANRHMKVVHDQRELDQRVDEHDDIDERLARLRGVYDKLDDRCRAVLDQFYFERKDLATIAAAMGVEEESIRTIKYRCMMKLRAFRRSIMGEENNAS
ncbi:MAG: sigma-70 family RNA polymerase sigma factor [Flavobacteriales bacterium]|nr:sigma-70 family RNA polymerase sigma factor [Flavobacteriales bacterium]